MVDLPWDEGSESIQRSEHISLIKTGDNIEAKRVANYVWDGVSSWIRATAASGGGGTQYTDGNAAATHPIGTQEVFTNGSGVTTAVSTANPLPVSASVSPVTDLTPATQNITARDIGSTTVTTNANSQSVTTGSPTAGSVASFTISSVDTVRVQVTGSWTGTLVTQISPDGVTWYNSGIHQTGTAYTTGTFTANFAGQLSVAGSVGFRVQSTTAWTGTATVKVIESINPASVYVANNLKIVDATTPTQGLAIDSTGRITDKLTDTLGNPISAFPATFLRTSDEPHQVFYDPFDSTLDVTNRWTSTQGSSGVAALNTTGQMAMGTGTVANGYSKLTSQPSFTLPIPAWLGVSDAITIPDLATPTANAYRFWGVGTTPGTPTATAPITDGVGFELSTAGKMFAVVYAGGTRTAIQDLSTSGNSTQPTDANQHRYIVYIRTDKAYWYIDGITSAQLVATSNFQAPQVQTLPKLFLAVGGSTPPGSNSQIMCNGATAWDTGKNANQLADGTFPWRKATINSSGALGIVNSELADITGTITNATQTTPVVASGLTGYDNVLVSINGTYNTATAIFQGSDDAGTTWYNISTAARSDSPIIEAGYTALTNITRAWNINIQGYDSFRVNPSAVASGTVNVRISPESAPSTAGATVTANISNGTNTADVVAGDTGFNGLVTNGGVKTFSFSASATGVITGFPLVVDGYSWIEVTFLNIATGLTITGESSFDNSTYFSAPNFDRLDLTAGAMPLGGFGTISTLGLATSTTYQMPVTAGFFRLNIQALTSGTVTGRVKLISNPYPSKTIRAGQAGTWSVGSNSATGSAVPANAFYMGAADSGPNLVGLRTNAGDATGTGTLASQQFIYNGTTNDRARSATAASNTTGTGLLGVGNLMFDGTNWQAFHTTSGDGASSNVLLDTKSMFYNGTTYDRNRNNNSVVVVAAGTTSTQSAVAVTTYNARSLVLATNITAGAGTLTVAIVGVTTSGYTYPVLTSTALTGVGDNTMRVFPGATPASNTTANDALPRSLQITYTVVGSVTYGSDAVLSV